MWSASELISYFQPVDHPLQTIRDNAGTVDAPQFSLHSFTPGDDRILLNFEVWQLPGERKQNKKFALGAAVATGAMLAGALISRRPDMAVRAISAGGAAGALVLDLCNSMSERINRWMNPRQSRWLAWSIGSQDAVFTFGDQQIHLSIPAVLRVAVRSIHEGESARGSIFSVQLDLEDGRLLPLYPFSSSEAALGMARQVARALKIPMVMQPVALFDQPGHSGLQFGPMLVEPGLN